MDRTSASAEYEGPYKEGDVGQGSSGIAGNEAADRRASIYDGIPREGRLTGTAKASKV